MSGKIILRRDELRREREALRAGGRRLVFTNGCFDILHVGHVRYLEAARALGDALLVAINADASVRALKGAGRPLMNEAERAEMLAALGAVDYVTVFEEESPRALIAELLPDVLVKGGDYAPEEIHGREEVEAAGGRVLALPFVEGASTTGIVERVKIAIVREEAARIAANRPVVIVEYDSRWPLAFEEEKRNILEAVGGYVAGVEHVGSTSVPGLASKPIIDIMVGVRSLADAPKCLGPLAEIGYEYVPRYELLMPERRFFRKGERGAGTHHLHMVEPSSRLWEKDLLFRDYLRAHAEAAREYEKLKRELAALHGANRSAYTDAKTDFVTSIIEKARAEKSVEQGMPGK
ncbi:MAG TPA: D-glycero-beta-D-manno-heptose 1-phosphate adenylyltransferase [Pyrinomonadaceae bacterium]|nr:D-glycero-beta-D-manno-heptose 1-phosphate adenylyltransferase [Pyrinomonadaceae bacterium]